MDLAKLKEFYLSREKPLIVHTLKNFYSENITSTSFNHTLNLNDTKSTPLNTFEQKYQTLYSEIRSTGRARMHSEYKKAIESKAHQEASLLN